MKNWIKIILLLGMFFFLSETLSAQHYLGVRGGYSGGYGRFQFVRRNANDSKFLFGWPSAGVSWKYYGTQRVVGGVQADLQMVKKGYQLLLNGTLNSEGEMIYRDFEERTLSAIELPFMWQPHLYFARQRGRIYMNLGVYMSYIYDSSYKTGVVEGWVVEESGSYEMKSVRDNVFEYGLVGGFGFSFSFDRFEVFLEGRYNFGYSDIMKARAKYPLNQYNRTPIDMLNISAGLYYRLGTGGIISKPAEKINRVRMGEWHDIPGGGRPATSSGSGSSGAQGPNR